ncbi:hypothetical protein ACSNOI_03250 [Actinomadura kijaniata]|uniref:hypothetical protein n=1 Tax=Actinomadura kijaniata TaxID=46161 RepID=UPI003F1A943D
MTDHRLDNELGTERDADQTAALTLDGLDGSELDSAASCQALWQRAAHDLRAQGITPQPDTRAYRLALGDRLVGYLHLAHLARWHNTAAPLVAAVAAARARAEHALQIAERRWHHLRTAHAWHAAHHAWIEGVHEAFAALDAWQHALEVARHQLPALPADLQQLYQARVPANRRIDSEPDYDAASRARATLRQTTAARQQIAAHTARATQTRPGTGPDVTDAAAPRHQTDKEAQMVTAPAEHAKPADVESTERAAGLPEASAEDVAAVRRHLLGQDGPWLTPRGWTQDPSA